MGAAKRRGRSASWDDNGAEPGDAPLVGGSTGRIAAGGGAGRTSCAADAATQRGRRRPAVQRDGRPKSHPPRLRPGNHAAVGPAGVNDLALVDGPQSSAAGQAGAAAVAAVLLGLWGRARASTRRPGRRATEQAERPCAALGHGEAQAGCRRGAAAGAAVAFPRQGACMAAPCTAAAKQTGGCGRHGSPSAVHI